MGILASIKFLAPLSIYLLGVVAFFMALTGRVYWTLALVTMLLPLRNVIDKLHQFPLGAQFIDILLFGMIIGWFISSSDKKPLMERSSLNIISFILVFYITFSLIIGSLYLTGSPIPELADSRTQDWKNFCLLPLLFMLTLNNVTDRTWINRMFLVMCFTILLSAYYTSTQITWFSSLTSRAKISGTFQFLGPNEVAAFLNQCTIILLGIYFFMKRGRNKFILLGIILLCAYCIIFLYSRAAYAGFTAGLFVLFAFKKRWLLIPLILCAALWQVVLPEKVIERIKETKNEYGELDKSSEDRILMWEVGLDLFQKSPVFGIGYGVFRNLGLQLGDTHNIYVKLLVEQGLLGLLVFLITIGCFFREGFILYQKGEDDFGRGLGLGIVACMVTLLVNNFFGDRWSYLELSAYLWIFAGLAARMNALSGQKPAETAMSAQKAAAETPKRKSRPSYYK